MRQLILNFQNDSEPAGGMKTSSSLAGSLDHANRTAQPENGSGRKMNATFGQKCLERFGKFNHVGLWAKTFSALLIGMEGWYSTRCKLTWKLKGTKYNRLYFQLQPSTLPIGETGFGLLPTVTAMDSSGATANMKSSQVKDGSMHSVTLSRALGMGLLPTPTASEVIESKNPREVIMKGGSPRVVNNQGTDGQAKLNDMARWGMLPTPTSTDYKGAYSPDAMVSKDGIDRSSLLRNIYIHTQEKEWKSKDGKTSHLNPRFVMEMMGFPPDWTELPFLSGDKNP